MRSPGHRLARVLEPDLPHDEPIEAVLSVRLAHANWVRPALFFTAALAVIPATAGSGLVVLAGALAATAGAVHLVSRALTPFIYRSRGLPVRYQMLWAVNRNWLFLCRRSGRLIRAVDLADVEHCQLREHAKRTVLVLEIRGRRGLHAQLQPDRNDQLQRFLWRARHLRQGRLDRQRTTSW